MLHLPWNPLQERGDLPLYEVIDRAWRSAGRAYHDVEHLGEMLTRCSEVARDVGWKQPTEVFLATLFHDAIYEPLAKDNEAKSAALARKHIAEDPRLAPVDVDFVARLVEATAGHGAHPPSTVDEDEGLFLDADMAILGATPERYRRYVTDVRREYGVVPEEAFVAGRAAFVHKVLASASIYISPYFRARLEQVARANVASELTWLEGGATPPWAMTAS
ncbi:MAG: hypothetical protein HOW73_02080 [Polyangiaceae bacterium]|nr:hypothetical protein [Polyangiaceae bacterium]